MHHLIRAGVPAALALIGVAGCADAPTRPASAVAAASAASVPGPQIDRHIVLLANGDAPADFAERLVALGGRVEHLFPGAGLAVVGGLTDAGAAELQSWPGVGGVARDVRLRAEAEEERADVTAADAVAAADWKGVCDPTAPPEDRSSAAKYYCRQWNLRAIGAEAAWAVARPLVEPSKVRVHLLDTGIDYTHPDLVGRVDLARSTSIGSMGAEDDSAAAGGLLPFIDFHSHGTSVASVIVSNGTLVAGVTQQTTLVAVKVHDRFRSGTIATYVAGILHAANDSADVIHLSIPAAFHKGDHAKVGDHMALVAAINKATSYAHRQGAVIVAASGNASAAMPIPIDFDHDADGFKFCNAVHVICVSATAPDSARGREGPWSNWDRAATYSFYGRSTISVAGPGGGPMGARTAATAVPLACSRRSHRFTDGQARCSKLAIWNNDPVWYSTGTSFGAAATSGLAALLVSIVGHGQPDRIRALIEQSADDLGQPGVDELYGRGRINVVRAIEMAR